MLTPITDRFGAGTVFPRASVYPAVHRPIALAKSLEKHLELPDGQFGREASYLKRFRVIGPEEPAWLICPVSSRVWI
jgi:hypothetical protein